MGEGQNKVARALVDLEPTSIVDLFILYPDINELPDLKIPFHGGVDVKRAIVWQGMTYLPIGIELDSFEKNSDGTVNRPKIKFSNYEYYITYLLKKYKDFASAKIVRKRTLVQFLDDENFDGGNPFGVPDSRAEITSEEYVISQKTQETKDYVEFELTSPLDLDNKFLTNRKIYGKYCFWDYRGEGCEYKGIPIQRQDGVKFTASDGSVLDIVSDKSFYYGSQGNVYINNKTYKAGDVVFVVNNKIKIHDPEGVEKPRPLLTYYIARETVRDKDPSSHPQFWERDGCSKKLSSCNLRFNKESNIKRFTGEQNQERRYFNLLRKGSTFRMIPRTVLNQQTILEDGTEENSTNELIDLINKNNWTVAINFKGFAADQLESSEIFSTVDLSGEGMFSLYRRRSRFYLQINFSGGSDTYLLPNFSEKGTVYNSPLLISRQNGNFRIQLPKTKFNKLITLGSTQKTNLKKAKAFRFFYDPATNRSMQNSCSSIIVFNQYRNDDYFNGFWLDDVKLGGLKPPTYNAGRFESKSFITAWWELKDDSSQGGIVPNQYPNEISDLFFYKDGDGTSEFNNFTEKHYYNEYKIVPTKSNSKNLPFGGFPGTDGFDFKQ